MLNELRALAKKLAVYRWLAALPQLTSRICHPCAEVKAMMQEILRTVATTFPQQARTCCWSPLASFNRLSEMPVAWLCLWALTRHYFHAAACKL